MPQVKTKQTSKKGKKGSSSSSNNKHDKSNDVASCNSIDSTNDVSLSQVTLEQENNLLKGIIEKGVFKSLAGCKQFKDIVHKHGGYRKNHGIGYFNENG